MNKNAFVTGGDKGIGRAIVEVLAPICEHVLFTYNENIDGARYLEHNFTNVHAYQCNLRDRDGMRNLAKNILSQYGHVDILVNNAGFENDATFLKMEEQQWLSVLDVNLQSLFYFTQAFANGMTELGWGRIINVSSILGYTGVYGGANYAASKAGVVGFTKSLAKELGAKGVTVNAIAPGVIETDLLMRMQEKYREKLREAVPSHRFGKPEDVASLVEFLISDKANYINGQTIHVNGGLFAI